MKKYLFILLIIIGVLVMLKPINSIIKDSIGNIIYRGNIVTGIVAVDNGDGSYDVFISESDRAYPKIFTLSANPDLAVGDKVRILYKNGCKELPIILPPVAATGINLYENQIVIGDNAYTNMTSADKREAMPILAISNHKVSQIYLYLSRLNSPGTVNISIKVADANKKPTGAVLASGNTDGDTLSETGEWREIDITSYTFSKDIWYVIIVDVPNAAAYDCLRWWGTFDDEYPDSIGIYSQDAGVNWYNDIIDFAFKIYG